METEETIFSEVPAKNDRRLFRKDINRLSRTLIIYEFMLIAVFLVYAVFLLLENPDITDELYELTVNNALENGWLMIAGLCLGMVFILLFRKKEFFSDLTKKNKSMTLNAFVKIFFCFMLVQPMFFAAGFLFEEFLNLFGYTNLADIESASAVSTTFSLFLYAAFLGPIAEEIVFRGAVLRFLEKNGKVFAIIVSAILFAFFHSNFTQGVFALFAGLVLGYVAVEYSLKWAVLLHIINNFVFSDLIGRLLATLDPSVSDLISYFLYLFFFVGGVLVLFSKRRKIRDYISRHPTDRSVYFRTFTAFWMVVFVLLNFLMAVTGITPLPA